MPRISEHLVKMDLSHSISESHIYTVFLEDNFTILNKILNPKINNSNSRNLP